MSGICGIINKFLDITVDQNILKLMNNTMIHRGPDDEDYYLSPGGGIAIRRLFVNYESDEKQYWDNSSNKVLVAIDGAIYNYIELKKFITLKGHKLQTSTNIELLEHLYLEMGDNFTQSLIGEFAIALWDRTKHRIILVRDRLGVKPLYFCHLNDRLIFASELRALIQYPEIKRDIDPSAFSEYLTFAHTIAPHTIIKNVQKISPGHIYIYDHGNLVYRKYWDINFPEDKLKENNFDVCVNQFTELFITAVKRRVQNVKVGAFLSGGMDSSSIVSMMNHLNIDPINTYSGGFLRDINDDGELSRARIVAKHFNTCHSELAFNAQSYVNALPRFISYMDDPVGDEASLIRMLLAERAKRDVTVILGGEGGDDVLCGYSFDKLMQRVDRIQKFQRLPLWFRQSFPLLISPFLPNRLIYWLARGNRDISKMNSEEHYSMIWAFEDKEKKNVCPFLRDGNDNCSELIREIYAQSHTSDPLAQAIYFFIKTWVSEELMMSTDKMTMSHSLEYRAPFLDHELVEFCCRLPSHYKIYREKNGKYTIKNILIHTMRDRLPDITLRLQKSPFQVPTKEWFCDTLSDFCQDILLSDHARQSGYYDTNQIVLLFESHKNYPTVNSMRKIKHLLFFEMWRRMVLE